MGKKGQSQKWTINHFWFCPLLLLPLANLKLFG